MFRYPHLAAVVSLLLALPVFTAPAHAIETTTWGSIKAHYRGSVARSGMPAPSMSPAWEEIPIEEDPGAGGPELYLGGPSSLPHGTPLASQTIVNGALTMPSVQAAISILQARGYMRRSDLDAGEGLPEATYCVLGFEKPGFDVNVLQPVLVIETIKQGDYWLTQLIGGVVEDSSGVPVPRFPVGEPPITIVGYPQWADAVTPGGELEYNTDVYWLFYDRDAIGSSAYPWVYIPQENLDYWRDVAFNVCVGAGTGALSRGPNWSSMAVGAVLGGALAGTAYMYDHPRP